MSALQSRLASEVGKDGPSTKSDAEAITKLPTERPSTSMSVGKSIFGKVYQLVCFMSSGFSESTAFDRSSFGVKSAHFIPVILLYSSGR